MFAINEILNLAIKLERNGETTYRRATSQIDDSELVALLNWMADEEVQHAKWFSNLKQAVADGESNPILEEMSRAMFEDLVGDQSFSLKEVDFSRIRTVGELMKVFTEFESDTVMFYEILIPFIEDQATLGHLKKIIAEEKHHIERLSEFKQSELEIADSAGLRR